MVIHTFVLRLALGKSSKETGGGEGEKCTLRRLEGDTEPLLGDENGLLEGGGDGVVILVAKVGRPRQFFLVTYSTS